MYELLQGLEEEIIRCMKCGYCRAACPLFRELSIEPMVARGKVRLIKALLAGEIALSEIFKDRIFKCLACSECVTSCPSGVKVDELILAARAEVVKSGENLPLSVQTARENLILKGNPFGWEKLERASWLPAKYQKPKKTKNLYYVSCSVAYSSNRIARAIIRILEASGYDFTLLGEEELCCGEPLFRMGEIEKAKELLEGNVSRFRDLGVETIFTSCAGCYKNLNKRYPKEFRVLHITQLFVELIAEGKLNFERKFPKKAIYFDGCDLGRHSGIYEEPRRVLKSIPGLDLLEFSLRREEAICCGGPLMASEPSLARKIAVRRVREAKDKGADLIVTSCPTCLVNLKEGAKEAKLNLEILDLPMLLPMVK